MAGNAAERVEATGLAALGALTWRDLQAGMQPQFVRELERREILERGDIRMIIPDRTLERRLSQNEALKLEEADGIARLLRVLSHAFRAFGDEALAEEWLRTPNPELSDEVPMRMARTDLGAREVEAVLTRIEHGVFG
jgi:putative toxin-antitoxin system antitoxin component (TIGR02293 family)